MNSLLIPDPLFHYEFGFVENVVTIKEITCFVTLFTKPILAPLNVKDLQFILFSSMYDVNGNGHIDLQEMTQIVRSIYHLIGPEQVGFGFHFQEQLLAVLSLD